MDIKENIIDIIRILKTKPNMVLTEYSSFNNYCIYIQGYFDLLKILTGTKFDREISMWYTKKLGIKNSNLFWFAEFESLTKHLDESERINIFLNTIEEFILENNFNFEKLIKNHLSL